MRIRVSRQLLFLILGVFGMVSPRSQKSIVLTMVLELGLRDEFIKVEEIASDSRNDIYVTDSYQFSVKKFDRRGTLKAKFGKRGKNAGEFKSFPFKIHSLPTTLPFL